MAATDTEIDHFIQLFNGNVDMAQHALEQYAYHKTLVTPDRASTEIKNIVINVGSLSKEYKIGRNTITALNDINLTIHEGEFIAITGASGSGKSTLLQMIGCLDKPTTGSVIVAGSNTSALSDPALSELRQKIIGFIFQSFYLQPFLTLSDNLAVPAMFTNADKKDITDKVGQLLQRVGLAERAEHYPKELSGGQIQRAAIARALINDPHIILADEPTGNLDSTNSQSIIDLFRTIRDTLGTTIVVVTHDPSIARQADRIIALKDGVIL
jgi:ABC-type lipoprotein export system ATPase subunit